jgi:hypothetical protein
VAPAGLGIRVATRMPCGQIDQVRIVPPATHATPDTLEVILEVILEVL